MGRDKDDLDLETVEFKNKILKLGHVVYAPFPGTDPNSDPYYWGLITKKYRVGRTIRYDIEFHDGDTITGITAKPLHRISEALELMDSGKVSEYYPPAEYMDIQAEFNRQEQEEMGKKIVAQGTQQSVESAVLPSTATATSTILAVEKSATTSSTLQQYDDGTMLTNDTTNYENPTLMDTDAYQESFDDKHHQSEENFEKLQNATQKIPPASTAAPSQDEDLMALADEETSSDDDNDDGNHYNHENGVPKRRVFQGRRKTMQTSKRSPPAEVAAATAANSQPEKHLPNIHEKAVVNHDHLDDTHEEGHDGSTITNAITDDSSKAASTSSRQRRKRLSIFKQHQRRGSRVLDDLDYNDSASDNSSHDPHFQANYYHNNSASPSISPKRHKRLSKVQLDMMDPNEDSDSSDDDEEENNYIVDDDQALTTTRTTPSITRRRENKRLPPWGSASPANPAPPEGKKREFITAWV